MLIHNSEPRGCGTLFAFCTIFLVVWAVGYGSCSKQTPSRTNNQSNPARQINDVGPTSVKSVEAPRPGERRYRDSHGAIITESEAEENLRQIRSEIRAMPDNNKRAYYEGMLRGLEEEWERIKSSGPINE